MSADNIAEGVYLVENIETKRYLFQTGKKIEGNRGREGGWTEKSGVKAPEVVGTDATTVPTGK